MVGERDHEQQDAVRWEQIDDDAAISIPPPFSSSYNGATQQQNHRMHQHILQQQQYAAMLAEGGAGDDTPVHWDDEQMGLMGDSMVGGYASVATEKGVRFPMSPTHGAGGFSNGQLSQPPLQSLHSRYERELSSFFKFHFLIAFTLRD
jgi:hypothetical protein